MKVKPLLAIITASDELQASFSHALGESYNLDFYKSPTSFIETIETENRKYGLIFSDLELQSQGCIALREARQTNPKLADVPFVLLLDSISNELRRECMNMRISDIVFKPVDFNRLKTIIDCEIERLNNCREIPKELVSYQLPTSKRIFDIIVSGIVLILTSPLLLIVGVWVAIYSKSAPFVGNIRVGMGSRKFKQWQFRTTYKDREKRHDGNKQVLPGNAMDRQPDRRALINKKCPECEAKNIPCQKPLCFDDGIICEKLQHKIKKPAEKEVTNEPGIHQLGEYLKKMKIENLPQLWNVFIGDMSIVGNDPVTVCEFNQLTFNENATRFCAPAGMLSLWKVMKTHNGALSEKARLTYDFDYAARAETGGLLLYDILLIMKWIKSYFVQHLKQVMNPKKFLIGLLMFSMLFTGCGQSKEYKDDKYEIGQIWEYETRDNENGSTFTIVELQHHDKLGIIINVYVDGLNIRNSSAETGFSNEIHHLPFSKEAIDKSVTKLNGRTAELPDFKEGYKEWKSAFDAGKAGIFTVTVKEAVEYIEFAINQ